MSYSREKVTQVYATIDSMSGKAFAEFFTPNGTFVFGNAQPVIGREAIAAYVDQFFSMIAGLRHDVEDVWEIDRTVISRFKCTYARKKGDSMAFPGINVWRIEGALIAEYRIYMDNSPLWS